MAVTIVLGLGAAGFVLAGLAPPARAAATGPQPAAALPDLDLPRLHPELLKSIERMGPAFSAPVIVELRRDPDLAAVLAGAEPGDAGRAALVAGLQAEAQARAGPVLDLVAARGGGVVERVFWASPIIRLEARADLVGALSNLPDVVQVRLDTPMRIAKFEPAGLEDAAARLIEGVLPWNLALIRLDLVQPGLQLDGSGVVVANLDTGVDWTHPALQQSYRGYDPPGPAQHGGNWHVSTGEFYPAPADAYGHGTHTMGTLVGEAAPGPQIGVAPGAKWIAVKMIDDQGIFFESWVHDAIEWLIAPDGDPGLAPDIVSGSWGTGTSADLRFRQDIQALRAAGILPVFAAGNAGPLESTVRSPADYPESLAVGAVDDIGLVTYFSGRGPSPGPWAEIKPELVAPGADVVSAVPGGGYAAADGTSMAAPHVAGAAALLLQAQPGLSPSQLEQVLLSSAAPRGAPGPDNDNGWGLLDVFAAALSVTPNGRIIGIVRNGDGARIAYPVARAEPLAGGPATILSGDADGNFSVPVSPGLYRLTIEAFGYQPAIADSIMIHNGSVHAEELELERLPGGFVVGTVVDSVTGQGVAAELLVLGAGITQGAGSGGSFAFYLPEGTWQIEIRSNGHRVGGFTAPVTAGSTVFAQAVLEPAPRILLVDSGRWYYHSQVDYFRAALDGLDYVYDLHDIRDPHGVLSGVSDSPTEELLAPYDLVIWSAPGDSPGLVGAGQVISGFLGAGGSLLVSGEDVAYWDAGGSLFVYPGYFPFHAGAHFEREGPQPVARGLPASFLHGIELAIGGPGTAPGLLLPDTVRVDDYLAAEPAMDWLDTGVAALSAGGCRPHRLVWTGFGLEEAGPAGTRVETLERILAWLDQPPQAVDLRLPQFPEPAIAAPGATVSRAVRVENAGTMTETFAFSLSASLWPVSLLAPGGQSTTGEISIEVPGCGGIDLVAQVTIPAGLPRDVFDQVTITAAPAGGPGEVHSTTLTTKTPAPVLVLDDGLFAWFGDRYAASLDRSGLRFDYVSTRGAALDPGVLPLYPLVVWTTGWDWFLSLPPAEQDMLAAYLRDGGRLLLSSQDLLNRVHNPALTEDYLGVVGASFEVTPTVALPPSGGALGLDPEAWRLDYPFINWSDGLWILPGAEPVVLDQRLNVLGVANRPAAAPDARVLFFSFPLEALSPDALDRVLRAGTLWLGPFGGSGLSAPSVVETGQPFDLALQLRSAETVQLDGVSLQLDIPDTVAVIPGTIGGSWWFDPDARALRWQGSLAPGAAAEFSAAVVVDPSVSGEEVAFAGQLATADGQVFAIERTVVADGPYLVVQKSVAPEQVTLDSDRATVVLTVTNPAVLSAAGSLTDTIPAGLALITGTLAASSGDVYAEDGMVRWTGTVDPDVPVTILYVVEAAFPQPLGRLVGYVEIWDGLRRRGAWGVLDIPGVLYFPLIGR